VSDLANDLRGEMRRRFPETRMEFLTGEEVVRIPCLSGAIGDLYITADDDEATVFVEDMTHGHFTPYRTQELFESRTPAEGKTHVIEECCEFLEQLFHDEIVVWVSADGQRGGWYSREAHGPPPQGSRAGTWSARLQDTERGWSEGASGSLSADTRPTI
jgi:hypothetical protein